MLDEIDYVLLTHLHGDHAGGLHPLILRKYFTSGERAKVLYATPNFRDELVRYISCFMSELDKYVELVPLTKIPEIQYVDTTGRHSKGLMSYAYTFVLGRKLVYYSGDLGGITVSEKCIEEMLKNHPEAGPGDVLVLHEVSFKKNRQGFSVIQLPRGIAPFLSINTNKCLQTCVWCDMIDV